MPELENCSRMGQVQGSAEPIGEGRVTTIRANNLGKRRKRLVFQAQTRLLG